jgi:hypothetical protein
VSRLAAVCCCNTDPATSPCLQWVQGCIRQFPTTVTVSFSGSYLLQQIDLCNPTVEIVTYRDYITYSGTITATAQSAFQLLGGFEGEAWTNSTGTATASWRRDTSININNDGTACGVWYPCSTETLPSQNMQLAYGSLVCQRNTVDGNQWYLNAYFGGTGTYTGTFGEQCCGALGCPPLVYNTPTALRVQGLFGSGCDAPMPPIEDFPNCNCPTAGLQVTFTRGDDTAVIAGPFRIQNATYFDDTLTQRHTFTGSASVSFT